MILLSISILSELFARCDRDARPIEVENFPDSVRDLFISRDRHKEHR